MGGKGKQGVVGDANVLSAKREVSLSKRPAGAPSRAMEVEPGLGLTNWPVYQGARRFREISVDDVNDIPNKLSDTGERIARFFREMGARRDKVVEDLVGQAEELVAQHPDAGVGMTPEMAAEMVAKQQKLKIMGKNLKKDLHEALTGLPTPPYNPEDGTLSYADDPPEYRGKTATERVQQYFKSHREIANALGAEVALTNVGVFGMAIADTLHYWANHPGIASQLGAFKPEDAAKQLQALTPEQINAVVDMMNEPKYADDQEGYAGLSAKARIAKALAGSGIIDGSAYHNQLLQETFRRWGESAEKMASERPEQSAEKLMQDLRAENDEMFKAAQEITLERLDAALADIGFSKDNYIYDELQRMSFDHWLQSDRAVPFEEFMAKGVAGLPIFKAAQIIEENLVRLREPEVVPSPELAPEAAPQAAPAPVLPKEDQEQLEKPKYEDDNEDYAGRSPEERVHKAIEADPSWGLMAPVGSALRSMLVTESVAEWKSKEFHKVKPESVAQGILKGYKGAGKANALYDDNENTILDANHRQKMREAMGDIRGALATAIASSGAYEYMLAHEAWRMWLESLKGSWRNNKRKKHPVDFAKEVLAKYEDESAAREAQRIQPRYNNDKSSVVGKSAVERAKEQLSVENLDPSVAVETLTGALNEWSGNLRMHKDYTPENAVSSAANHIRERKRLAGKEGEGTPILRD